MLETDAYGYLGVVDTWADTNASVTPEIRP